MKRYNIKKNIRWNTMKILVTGFLLAIVTGAVLLWLPVSNQKPIEFFDALFTSASAVCVTGLVFSYADRLLSGSVWLSRRRITQILLVVL